MANSKCNGCINQTPDRPGLFCYMFRAEPEELPCSQFQDKKYKPHVNVGKMKKSSSLASISLLARLLAGK